MPLNAAPAQPVPASTGVQNLNPIRPDASLISAPSSAAEVPIQIIIPSLGLNLAITPASVVNGTWEVSDTAASFGTGSAVPGETGNTVVFAHARPGLFQPLRQLKVADSIFLLTASHWYRYSVAEIFEVTPDQTEVIYPSETPLLTLFTCSGFSDSRRLVVKAVPQP